MNLQQGTSLLKYKSVFKSSTMLNYEELRQSTCLLTISVGQEAHEAEKFAATVDLVNSSFGSCVLLIDDTVQRHTMALTANQDASFFYDFSKQEGDLWLERNKHYYARLTILKEIVRWDRWLFHAEFDQKKKKIMDLISENQDFKESFDKTIDQFLKRYFLRSIESQNLIDDQPFPKRAYQLCLDYLIEECAAFTLWPELNCRFEVYPGKRNLALEHTHRILLQPDYGDLLTPIAIKFKNRGQYKPQTFQFFEKETHTVAKG